MNLEVTSSLLRLITGARFGAGIGRTKVTVKTVTAAVIVERGAVLLMRRKPGQALEGMWEFPGGKLEDGESLQQCLERELTEELGIRARAGAVVAESVFEYPRGSIRLVAIQTQILDGDIQLRVHDRFAWVSLSGLLNYALAPADIPIARRLMELSDGL